MVFTLIGVGSMVTVMATYNKALEHGLTWDVFGELPLAFALRAPLAFALQFFVVQKFAGRMTSRYQSANSLEYYAIRTGFTVLLMCPIMSFYSVALYVGFTADFVLIWLTRIVLNWMFAFCVQIFLVGPLVRKLFRLVTGSGRHTRT
ncbi:MAG: DUF2798 domain-containing protein [Bifidobacteriaceae bacterium]|nr:DUF2798 domain-containing protein [Bifidobacteriaceae bacterium]